MLHVFLYYASGHQLSFVPSGETLDVEETDESVEDLDWAENDSEDVEETN